jgi:O-antigen biosynthesis protein
MQALQSLERPQLEDAVPFRAGRRPFARRSVGPSDPVPCKDLDPAPGGAWRSTGRNPEFLIRASFPPGWVRIRLALTTAAAGWLELRADHGAGFDPAACVLRIEAQGAAQVDCCVYFDSPVCAFRLDPLDGPGEFRLDRLCIEPLGALRALGHAVAAKVALVHKYRHTGTALRRALGMLARGDFARLGKALFRTLNGPDFEKPEPYEDDEAYAAWRRSRGLSDVDRARLRAEAAALAEPPTFSVLLSVVAGREADLRRSIVSVLAQTYGTWELIAVTGESEAARAVLTEVAGSDARIRILELPSGAGLAEAVNAALGAYITLLDEGDELAEQAFSLFAQAIVAGCRPDMLYADEDQVTPDGRHVRPFFKPSWSPDLLLSWMYTGRPGIYRTDLVRQLGGFHAECDPAYEYDMALRIAATSPRVDRVADVLYHRRAADGATTAPDDEPARTALRGHLQRTGQGGAVEPGPRPGLHRVRFALHGEPTVSIILASACRPVSIRGENTFYLLKCLESIRKSSWPRYEIIVQHGPHVPPALARRLDELGAIQAGYAAPFNWSRAMNQGATLARGEHLLFLNDDIEVITCDWLERLLEFSQQPDVGAVGAKLLFPGGRLQHAGIAVVGGRPLHPFYGRHAEHSGYFHSLQVPRNCSAVTGACLMTRAEVFHSVGGFDEAFPLNYNDVDYGLRLVAGGRRVVCTPHARLYHHELGTRSAEVHPEERDALLQRWGAAWADDPFCNPHLCPEHLNYR